MNSNKQSAKKASLVTVIMLIVLQAIACGKKEDSKKAEIEEKDRQIALYQENLKQDACWFKLNKSLFLESSFTNKTIALLFQAYQDYRGKNPLALDDKMYGILGKLFTSSRSFDRNIQDYARENHIFYSVNGIGVAYERHENESVLPGKEYLTVIYFKELPFEFDCLSSRPDSIKLIAHVMHTLADAWGIAEEDSLALEAFIKNSPAIPNMLWPE